ncbi:MAG: hypothetical protein ABFR65_03285 [Pseudomonadota bacterium]
MSLETYNVYFSGQIMKDRDPAEVRKRIGALFKLKEAGLEQLFSGQAVAIKQGVDMEQAVKYRLAFREAGALVDIRPVETGPAASASAPDPRSDVTQHEGFTLSEPNNFDLSDCAPVVKPQEIPDISALDLNQPGVILDERSQPEPLTIDTDELELDRPGISLDETAPPAAAEINTDELTLNPANQGSLEEYQQTVAPAQLPNIDHLRFTEQDEKPKG